MVQPSARTVCAFGILCSHIAGHPTYSQAAPLVYLGVDPNLSHVITGNANFSLATAAATPTLIVVHLPTLDQPPIGRTQKRPLTGVVRG
jgi:hypothetical protein